MLGLRARYCHSGDILADEQVQAARKEDVLNALSQIASKFRIRVGESLTTSRHNTPLAGRPPALDALKAYSTALLVSCRRGLAPPCHMLKHAVEIDPQFAMAYADHGAHV